MTTDRKLRLGLVGGGPGSFIGPVHLMAARLDHAYELAAGTFSRDPAKSREAGASYGLASDHVYDDYREMLKGEVQNLDLVCIATPNDTHHAIARAALDAGLHVMSDKPATLDPAEAIDLRDAIARSGCQYGLTYTYTGYPMVRDARRLIADNRLGTVRKIVVEYAQGWLTLPNSSRQAEWRTDPARAGAGGCIGDIGIHAFHLAEFVTGLKVQSLCADLASVVPGRSLDDDCNVLMHFTGGARGVLVASQVSAGARNGLRLQVYGTLGGLEWNQENPNLLSLKFLDAADEVRHAGAPYLSADAKIATRLPTGHPEGYIEAFANLYRDFAVQIHEANSTTPTFRVPGIEDGIRGMAFIETAVRSSGAAAWCDLRDDS